MEGLINKGVAGIFHWEISSNSWGSAFGVVQKMENAWRVVWQRGMPGCARMFLASLGSDAEGN
jgi:hypothetical protein